MAIMDGLISYWRLDGTSGPVIDSHGVNDGTNDGATRGVTGKIGNAFDFDGIDDSVDILEENTQIKTAMGWIKEDDDWKYLVSYNNGEDYGTKEKTYINNVENNYYEIWKDETIEASTDVYSNEYTQDEGAAYTNTYTLTTGLNEGATHRITFTATDKYMAGIYVYIVAKGTGNWRAYLHRSNNNYIAQSGNSTTTPIGLNENLTIGWYFFPLPVALNIDEVYHIHLYSSVADGTVKSNTTDDFETASYKITKGDKDKSITVTVGEESLTLYSNDDTDGLLDDSTIDLDAQTFVYDPDVNDKGYMVGQHCDIYEPTNKRYFMLHGAGQYDIFLSSTYLTYKVNTILPALKVEVKGPSTVAGRAYNVEYSFDNSNWTKFIDDTEVSGAVGTFNAQRHNLFYIRINHLTGSAKYIGTSFHIKANLDVSGLPYINGKIGIQTGGHFGNIIDEVGTWNRALSLAERTKLYNLGNGFQYPFEGMIFPGRLREK